MAREKPLLIYDGRCGFCKIWIDYWKQLTGDRVDYAPSQEVRGQFPQIPAQAFSESVQLVRTDGSVINGARAVFETLGLEKVYERSGVLAWIAERGYRVVARHRDFFYWVTRLTFGTRLEPARFAATQWIFLRALAVVYGIAFLSLATQIKGLIGSHGILPLAQFMDAVAKSLGPSRFYAMPTVFWIDSSDGALMTICVLGVAFSLLLLAGRLERLMLVLLFVLYLSLSLAGQDFLSFQWDALLLEAGFLAIFLGRATVIVWLFRVLVFRLNFMSGFVKLLSGDPTWRSLTALDYHYHTQPLPNFISWYADKLPRAFEHFSTAAVLGIEIGIPFLIFLPRRIRIFGAWCLIGLQILILLTGNFAFFNWLTLALCVFLFDDQALARFAPRRPVLGQLPRVERAFVAVFAGVMFLLGSARILEMFGRAPDALSAVAKIVSPFQIVNSYGLFASMTTTRPEIIVEGSDDGDHWTPYEFRYKPGDLNRAPRWVAPFQPRLDWQMWFAALGNYRQNLWFVGFVAKLLEGSPDVIALIEKNPFPNAPPKYIRAMVYEYSFTNRGEPGWWTRKPLGTYLPPVGMREK
ncbi:MAG: lipase maturation factor family protein [Acidobacteriia bacterium]|nr:lipase maturation factor family protein [Terriglobia bacterium]